MNKKISFVIICFVVLCFISCKKRTSSEFIYEHQLKPDIDFLVNNFDSLLTANTGESELLFALQEYFDNIKDYNAKSEIIKDSHNLFIKMSLRKTFIEIWKLDWGVSPDYKYNIWILPNLENGIYWRYIKENNTKLSSIDLNAFQLLSSEDNNIAYEHYVENISAVDLKNEISKELITMIVLTRIINAY